MRTLWRPVLLASLCFFWPVLALGLHAVGDSSGATVQAALSQEFAALHFVEPPTPPDGATVGGTLTPLAPANVSILVDSTDPVPDLASVSIEVWHISPGSSFQSHSATLTTAPYQTTWPTDYTDNGVNEIRATAFDDQGNPVTSRLSRTLNVNNATFADVPFGAFAWQHIERIVRIGVTAGCAEGPPRLYCPTSGTTRGQMAVFLVRAVGQTPLTPPTPTFSDVPPTHLFFGFIERIYAMGITSGCFFHPVTGERRYCPDDTVTRGQMAVFIIKAIGEAPLFPPSPTFQDVSSGHPFFGYIERMYQLSITAGCATSPLKYCPSHRVTRDQMAVFLVKAFNIAGPP